MSHAEPEHGETIAPHRTRMVSLFSAAVVLLLIAWLTAHYPPIHKTSAIEEVSPSYNLLAAGALPWFLQWTGVICAILACCASRNMRRAAIFAIAVSFILAVIWWCGLAFRFRGMDPLDAIVDLMMFQIQSQFGNSSTIDEILFNLIGPMLAPIQVRGPTNLQGWNFLAVLMSTMLLIGYLLFVGHVCRIGTRTRDVSDYVKFVALLLPFFAPPFIRLGIQIAQIG